MRIGRSVIALGALISMLLVAAACGQEDPTATPTSVPTATAVPGAPPTATPDAEAVAQAEFEVRWAELIAAAQEEGEVQFLRSITSQLPVYKLFEDKFGIKIGTGTAGGRASTDRYLAERAAGRYLVDVTNVGGGSSARLLEAGVFVPIMPELFHPDALDLSKWRDNLIPFADEESTYQLAWSFQLKPLADVYYNPNTVSQAEADSIQSYRDLLKPEFHGRIVVQDPAADGSSGNRIRVWQELGPDFFDQLIRQQQANMLPYGDTAAANGIARGKYDFAIFGSSGDFDAMEELGLPVRSLTRVRDLEGGLVLEVGPGTSKIGLLEPSAHPNAARLFLNWFLTLEAQTAWNSLRDPVEELENVSLRLDTPQGIVADRVWKIINSETDIPLQLPDKAFYQGLVESKAFIEALYAELGIQV